MESADWGGDETLAWTTRDGMLPPPRGASPWFLGAIATSMVGVWIGIIATDALCPDHRLWVQTLAGAALVASIAAIVGLFTGRSWAPLAALGAALIGIAIGVIDAIHDPTRGALISLAFGVVGALLVIALIPQLRSALWPRRATRDMKVDVTGVSPRTGDGLSVEHDDAEKANVEGVDDPASSSAPRLTSRE
jgi:hypothetical protein